MSGEFEGVSFLELWDKYTEHLPSPQIFRDWTGVSILAGAMERRLYTTTARGPLYPALFVLLVAPPGVGKNVSVDEAYDLWSSVGQFTVAPTSVTKASLIDTLKESAKTMILGQTQMIQYHSVLVPCGEFGTFVPKHDLEFLNVLNFLYDCPKLYDPRTRSLGTIKIDYPHLCLLGGTQPKFLSETMPDAAFGMGFTSRIIMVYAGEPVKTRVFTSPPKNQAIRLELIRRLGEIAKLVGEFEWDEEAVNEFETWVLDDCPPKPSHPKLQNYNTRRFTHTIKLAMVYSISESHNLLIRRRHFEKARELLLSAEALMPEIFREMSSGGYGDAAEEAFNFLWTLYVKQKKPIPESKLVRFLQQRAPANQIAYLIEIMIKSNQIKVVGDGPDQRYLEPIQMHLHGEA